MRERPSYNPKFDRKNNFQRLREQIHKEIEAETEKRIRENPKPTEEETMAGAFREMIETQVRDALFEFYRKGYPTESSGFGGEFGETQSLDGYFEIDEETKKKMEALGVKVLKGIDLGLPGQTEKYTYIQFNPSNPDTDEIKKKWDTIAALLPQRKEPAQPSISGGSEDFRKQYAANRTDIEKAMLQKCLAIEKFSPEVEEEMRSRLEELSK
ncbi:MAG: hypothetical protein KBD73_02740 [Candidatus Magasanikbacteria bacterium]|nr:hypothetical protein [Candidatus Magasanikbacteria bacterium]